ncbi:MAG: MAPEG family protein [Sphingomonas sp.]|uniref:MAPEG family protein n=1 Tax=Sphingomonas sp. TaxID=28214 RepID=UPI003F812DCD
MQSYAHVALVTLSAGLLVFVMAFRVSRAHIAAGILPPAMTGDPVLERTARAHVNTVEWMPIFLPAMWLFAIYWNATWAAVLGAIWIVGRIVYFIGYVAAPERRFPGFAIQAFAATILVLGAMGRIVYLLATGQA